MLPGSGEMEHGKASAFLWMRTSKEGRLVNAKADACNMQMLKRRCVPSLLMEACLCHRRCWIDDEAGEGQSAQVRGTPDTALTGVLLSVTPQRPFFPCLPLFAFGLLLCVLRPY